MSQQGDAYLLDVDWAEVDRIVQGNFLDDESHSIQPDGPHESIVRRSDSFNRSVQRHNDMAPPSIHRSRVDPMHPSQRDPIPSEASQAWWPGPTAQCPMPQSGLQRYGTHHSGYSPFGPQYLQPLVTRMEYTAQRSFTRNTGDVLQLNGPHYLHKSAAAMRRPMYNSEPMPRSTSAQAAIMSSQKHRRGLQSSKTKLLSRSPEACSRSPASPQAGNATTSIGVQNSHKSSNGEQKASISQAQFQPRSSNQVSKPTSRDWTTYRVDKKGTRLPKTTPPPQGTYKVNEGIGVTDYSDPRDFFAPSATEQNHVWNALQTVRASFYNLTRVKLEVEDMKDLSLGYNASCNEIKRSFIEWVFQNFSPDRTGPDRIVEAVQSPCEEVPGYTIAEEVQVIVKQPYNPKNICYFVKRELAINVDELLPRLERWYGLIEDFRFSPTWPYERCRDSQGRLVQHSDCFACVRCRTKQIVCHGFRERADRKCTPCASAGLTCSNEEEVEQNKLIWC